MKNFSACLTIAAGLSLTTSAHDVDDPFKEMVRSQPPVPPHASEGLVSQSAVLAALRKDAESGSDEAKYLLSVVTTGHPDGPTDLQLIESDQDFLILTLDCGNGYTKSIYEFGMRSLLGIGFARDPAKAAYWFGRAAEEGNAQAIFTMGRLAEDGVGVPRSTGAALGCYRQAAAVGNLPAQVFLYVIYRDGLLGIAPDAVQAASWRQRILDRRKALDDLLPQSDKVILEQDRTKIAAEAGDVDAQLSLARMYVDPNDPYYLNDREEGHTWHARAAAQGSAEAMSALGSSGSDAEELYWSLQAARLGHGSARQNVAWSYLEGRTGLPKDEAEGLFWMLQATASGDDYAAYHLGKFYEKGRFVKKDLAQARHWYEKALTLGSFDAEDALNRLDRPKEDPGFVALLPDGSISPEAKEALDWLSTLGLPSVRELPTVRVRTGAFAESQGKSTFFTTTGFLIEETQDHVVILNPGLARETYRNSPKNETSAHRENISFDEFVDSVLTPSRVEGRSLAAQAPNAVRPVEKFLLAWCCQQKQRDDLAKKLLVETAKEMKYLQVRWPDARTWKDFLKQACAEYFYQIALLDFGDPGLSREQLVERLHGFADKFSDTKESAEALALADGLDSLIKDEANRPPAPTVATPPEERARALVWRLRDLKNEDPETYAEVVQGLTNMGDAAVPALIDALDDHRPTRNVFCSTWNMRTLAHLDTIGDYAENILRTLSHNYPFAWRTARMGTSSPAQPSPLRREFEAWWASCHSKGEKQCLLDGIGEGGSKAIQIYTLFSTRFPGDSSEAGEAIAKGYRASSEEDRLRMIAAMKPLRHPAWIAALWEEVREGKSLPLKVRAAICLRGLGENADEVMLAKWLSVLGDWGNYRSGAYYNGCWPLFAYLLNSDDPSISERAVRYFPKEPRWQINSLFEGLGNVFQYSITEQGKAPPPAVQSRVEKIYAYYLQDDWESWTDPRGCDSVGDWAAERLASLLPNKYSYDASETFTQRAAARVRMRDTWRTSVGLPRLQAPKLPVASEKNRNTITDIAFGDNYLDGTPLHEEIEKLRGQKLAPEILVQLVRDFAARMPAGISGLQIRAVRTPSGGVAVKVWAEHGSTDPAKRYARSTTVVSQSGKNLLADTDVPKPGAASQPEAWKDFTRALTKALGGSPDSEIVARIGLTHSDRD